MMAGVRAVVEFVLPSVLVFTTLFGLMARGSPKPGGVALFFRVGLAGLVLGGALFFVSERWLGSGPATLVHAYEGFVAFGALACLFAGFGAVLKRQ
jgi:hypothetical protein